MDLQKEKEKIKSDLDKVEDKNLVKAIQNMLAFGKAREYEQSLHPLSSEEFYYRNKQSRKAIEEDNLISHEEVKSYFKNKNA